MKVVRLINFKAPPARVAEVLCSEQYNVERERGREGVVSTDYKLVEQGPERTLFDVCSIEYKRTMTGSLDKSGTVQSLTRNVWNHKTQTLTWTFEGGPAPLRMQLGGVYRLAGGDGHSELKHEISIEVKVPLIGEKIAKLAAREFEKSADVYERLLQRLAEQG
jgi:hypothetical protein